jgi:hypothetical protein
MNKSQDYKGFEISWQEPPMSSAKWTANVGSDDTRLYTKMARHGSQVIDGQTRDEMIANAKACIDGLGV